MFAARDTGSCRTQGFYTRVIPAPTQCRSSPCLWAVQTFLSSPAEEEHLALLCWQAVFF